MRSFVVFASLMLVKGRFTGKPSLIVLAYGIVAYLPPTQQQGDDFRQKVVKLDSCGIMDVITHVR